MSPFRTMLITYPQPPRWCQRGFTALESLLLLVTLTSGWVITAQFLQQQVQDTIATATARQLRTVSRQSHQWLLDHWQPLQQQFEESDHQESLDLLPLLPLSHRPPAQNPYQQSYQIRLIPAAHRWQLWVTTHGGPDIPTRSCRQITAQVGTTTGYLTQTPAAAWIVKGWQGLWHSPWPNALGPSPKKGHLATRQTIDLPQLTATNQILSRKPLASIATKHNQLKTDLQLNSHQLTFKNQQHTSRFSSQQWLLSQGLPSLQAIKLTAQGVTVENSLHWGESTQKTLRLHHFLFTISDNTEKKRVSLLRPMKKLLNSFTGTGKTRTYLQLREPQCASQIHQFWNKLPYHECSPQERSPKGLENFTDSVCQEDSDNQRALGRLFLVGSANITTPAALFICSKSTNGVAAFQLNKVDGYQPRRVSSKANAPTTTQTIRVKLPKVLSDDDEAADYLSLLNNIAQHLVFFDKAAKIYHELTKNGSVHIEKSKLKDKIKNTYLFNHLSNKTFDELFKIYCEPLSTRPPQVINYTTYDALKNLDLASLIPHYNNKNHFTLYESIYKTLNQPETKLKFKKDYNEKIAIGRLKYFIKEIEDNFDNANHFAKRIFMEILINLQQDYPLWIEQQTKPYPMIIGINLPKKIKDIKQAEEIISLLLIVISKIEEEMLLYSNKGNRVKRRFIHIKKQDYDFYHQFKNSLSEITIDNKDDFLKTFMTYYNEKSGLNKSNSGSYFAIICNAILDKLPHAMKAMLSNNNLRIFIERIQNIKKFDCVIRADINNLLLDVVNTYYQNSPVIKIQYAETIK